MLRLLTALHWPPLVQGEALHGCFEHLTRKHLNNIGTIVTLITIVTIIIKVLLINIIKFI